jgi:hypothetical protein
MGAYGGNKTSYQKLKFDLERCLSVNIAFD